MKEDRSKMAEKKYLSYTCCRCANYFLFGCTKGHPKTFTYTLGSKEIDCKDYEPSLEYICISKINPMGVNKKHFQGFIGKVKKYFRES